MTKNELSVYLLPLLADKSSSPDHKSEKVSELFLAYMSDHPSFYDKDQTGNIFKEFVSVMIEITSSMRH